MELQTVPVVDLGQLGLQGNINTNKVDKETKKKIADQIVEAFSTIGFVYLKNHGIDEVKVSQLHDILEQFFILPTEVKNKYSRGTGLNNFGWVCSEREWLNHHRPADPKECFDIHPPQGKEWPDKEVPKFKESTLDLYSECHKLGCRILDLLAIGLQLEDVEYFSKRHSVHDETYTHLRLLYYPQVEGDMKPGQIRLGEHSDYGSITLLFQDDVGGLEIKTTDGNYIMAPTIPGAIIVNIGDLMERWTADKLISTKHRVVHLGRDRARRSIAFFMHPHRDCLVECIDGTNKYPPITDKEYLEKRFNDTFKY